jgi:hypothetical protein
MGQPLGTKTQCPPGLWGLSTAPYGNDATALARWNTAQTQSHKPGRAPELLDLDTLFHSLSVLQGV